MLYIVSWILFSCFRPESGIRGIWDDQHDTLGADFTSKEYPGDVSTYQGIYYAETAAERLLLLSTNVRRNERVDRVARRQSSHYVKPVLLRTVLLSQRVAV